MTTTDDRLLAVALLYIDAIDRRCEDEAILAEGALLALLPPVVAPPCAGHDESQWAVCVACQHRRCDAHLAAIGAALDRLGLRNPW